MSLSVHVPGANVSEILCRAVRVRARIGTETPAGRGRPLASVVAVLLCVVATVLLSAGLAAAGAVATGTQDGETAVTSLEIAESDRTLVDDRAQHFTAANFDSENIQLFSDGNPTQDLQVSLTVAGDTGTETLVIDYSESVDANLELAAVELADEGPLAGAVTATEVRNEAGELLVEFDTGETGDVAGETQTLTVEWTADDGGIEPAGGDAVIDHVAELAGTSDRAEYQLTARGATAIAPGDATYDFSTSIDPYDIELARDGSGVAFNIWQGQAITFQVPENGDTVDLYEFGVEDRTGAPDVAVRGDLLRSLDTAPGAVTNVDTDVLEANERYIVAFEGTEEVVILDMDPLNLDAEPSAAATHVAAEARVDVTSDDVRGGANITAYYYDDTSTLLHRETDRLNGGGYTTVEGVDPGTDLDGPGNYSVVVEHEQSEVRTAPVAFSVVDTPEEAVTITSPTPDDSFTRGGFVPIELAFENTSRGTLTFGDRSSPQNIEIHVTVEDTDGDGTATVYLNTYQVGDGARTSTVYDETRNGGPIPDGQSCEARNVSVDDCPTLVNAEDNANHGFVTAPDDGGSAIRDQPVAHGPSLDIRGGSAGGHVPFPQAYDLVTASGTDSYMAAGQVLTDRSVVRITPEGNLSYPFEIGCHDVDGNGNCATDTTDDGLLDDIDGDGEFTADDVQLFVRYWDDPIVQDNASAFDFDWDGEVSLDDVPALLRELPKTERRTLVDRRMW